MDRQGEFESSDLSFCPRMRERNADNQGGWRRGAQHGVDKARAAGQRAVEQAKEKVRR